MLRDNASKSNQPANLWPRTRRLLLTLLVALAGCYWVGRLLGLTNDELLGYLAVSVGLVVLAGLVALLLFGVVRLFHR